MWIVLLEQWLKTNANQIKRVCFSCKYHWKLIVLSLFNNGVFPFGESINILFPRDECTIHTVSNHTLINHVASSIRYMFRYAVNSKRGFVTLDYVLNFQITVPLSNSIRGGNVSSWFPSFTSDFQRFFHAIGPNIFDYYKRVRSHLDNVHERILSIGALAVNSSQRKPSLMSKHLHVTEAVGNQSYISLQYWTHCKYLFVLKVGSQITTVLVPSVTLLNFIFSAK